MGFYWDAVQLNVCRRCIDGDHVGKCHLPNGEFCALEEFFPEIVRSVSTVRSSLLEDHVKAVRTNVCARCLHQLPDGYCPQRKNQACSLDRFFPLVVETIQAVQRSITPR